MRRLLLGPVVAALLVATSLTAPRADAGGTTTVSGKVVDENGRPVNGLDVFSGFGSDTTNASGSFTVTAPSGGGTLDFYDNTWQQFGFDHTYDVASGVSDIGTLVFKAFPNPDSSPQAYDTSSKSAVQKAYRTSWKSQFRNERLIRPHGCQVRKTPKAAQQRTINAVNFARRMSGLDPVTLSSALSDQAQKAALIQHYQGYLNHYPSLAQKCATKVGVATSGKSNLALGFEGAGNIAAYMEDFGASNIEVGHRRWIQDPFTEAMGTGQVGRAEALYVVAPAKHRSASNPVPEWLSWPTAGYFPAAVEPGGRWSFGSARRDLTFAKARVKVLAGAKQLNLRRFSPIEGYGEQNTLAWDLAKRLRVNKGHVKTLTVKISGMRLRGLAVPTYTYQVRLFT